MRHPTDGTLRRLVDEPAGVADADREHVADCPVCVSALATSRDDAAAVGAALDVELAVDVDAAWQRFSSAVAVEGRPRAAAATPGRRWRPALRSPRVAAVAVVALLAGAGAAAAADWLQIFHTEEIAPIKVTQADLVKLPDLSSFGDLDLQKVPEIREVDDAAAAEARTGLSVPQVGELPRGVTGEPTFQVGGQVVGMFTYSSEDVAAQLRRFSSDGTTLPLPVQSDEVENSAADVGGAPATVLTARDGTMAGVIWIDDGIVNAVAGSLSDDEVLSVARGLRWGR